MIDFNYDKIIILKYTLGSGGKFLVNSLSLTDDAVFLNDKLAQLQLHKKFTIKHKLHYLNYHLKHAKHCNLWDDLCLSEKKFFGLEDFDYFYLTENDIINYSYKDIVQKCIDKNKFIFLTIHEKLYLSKLLNCWKNSKFILFINEDNFIQKRNQNLIKNLKKNYYNNLPFYEEKNIILKRKPLYEWDCDWYFSEKDTLIKIKELYEILGITGFDKKLISWYYRKWIEVIK